LISSGHPRVRCHGIRTSYIAPREVFAMTWLGGGYGDPLK
jgi:hypothetical protein